MICPFYTYDLPTRFSEEPVFFNHSMLFAVISGCCLVLALLLPFLSHFVLFVVRSRTVRSWVPPFMNFMVIRPGFDGGSVTRKMRTWREEAMTHDKGIEGPSGVS